MEKNGELGSNFMAVDPVSPASSNSKEVSDEPAAPRRSSIDDNDPTRPRKRLAAMAIHDNVDNTKQVLPPKDEVLRGEPGGEPRQGDQMMEHKNHNGATSKPDEAFLEEDEPASSPSTVQGIGNKITIHLRTPHLPESKEDGLEGPTDGDDENDEQNQLTPTSSEPPRSTDSLQGESPNGSLRSPEIEVEEVEEMEEDDDLAGHITIMDDYINNPINTGGTAKVKEIMDTVTTKLERDPTPSRQLDEIMQTMSNFVNVVGDHIDNFYKLYHVNQDVWPNLPNLMEALLKRTEPFGQNYFRKVDKSVPGLEAIILALVEFSRLTALFVRYDVWALEHPLPDRDVNLLSWGYQRTLSLIMRSNQLFSLMQRNYSFNMFTILPRVIRAFTDTHDGLESLRKFDDLILQRIPLQPKFLAYAYLPLEIYTKLIRCLEAVVKEGAAPDDWSETQIAISDGAFKVLTSAENLLAGLFETHLQLLVIKDFNGVLNALCALVTAFYGMNSSESKIRELIEKKIGNDYGVIEPHEYPALAEWACRFPFLLKMLTSNRMDFRLQGLVRATELLVGAWRDNCGNSNSDWHDSALLRFLGHFIIENKVVEYIMGPESHHELIRRSANITGFLIVTHTTTADIRHALWQPVVNNKDPRIVQATLAMHQDMIPNMSIPLLVELSKRVRDIPFSSFDAHMMDLVSRLLETIRNTFYQQQQVIRLDPAPYEMLIRLIRAASCGEENAVPSGGLPPSMIFESAGKELMALAEYGPAGSLRREIFLECISDIEQMNSSATGSINVIQAFLQQRPRNVRPGSPSYVEDIEYLIKDLNLAELLVNEIARFVDSHSKHDQYSTLRRLKARLELLQFILYNSPECLTPYLGEKLWRYLVGDKALGTSERDHGFEFYINYSTKSTGARATIPPSLGGTSLTDQQQTDPILDSVFRIYFPALDPACFSPHVLSFCIKSIEYLNKTAGLEDKIDEDCVNLEGIEQLWRIILKAPNDRLAADATAYFVTLYLDSRAVCMRSAKVVETTHFKIVERCISQLTSAASKIDSSNTTIKVKGENKMPGPFNGSSDTREFFRSLDLLDQFIRGYKSRSRYNQGPQEASQASTVDMITGAALTLRLRWQAMNYQSPIHTFKIGNLDTGQDLHDRITKIIGGDKYRLILAGRELKPIIEPLKTVKDFGILDDSFLIVQKTLDQGTTTVNLGVLPSTLNALQVEIMRHFDSLFELLCLPEPQATKIWTFLRNFPVDEHIKSNMISGPIWSEIFPAEHPYKTLYSLHALRTCFDEQKQQQSDKKSKFINEAATSLLRTLMDNHHESKESYAMKTRAQVTNEVLECLRLFLQESATESNPSPSFSDPEGFVQRIFDILRVCSESEYAQCPGSEPCVANAFNVLLIASKIDPKIWSSLTQKPDLIYLTNRFLLRDERQKVRLGTGEAIIGTFNRPSRIDKPTTYDFARFFWGLLKDILYQDSLDPNSSAEIFQTALFNFKFLGEESPESLDIEACFNYWSSRLIKYKVNEVVGCSNEDFVVTGFTKLLTRCVILARNRGVSVRNEVAEEIFRNLLFPSMTAYSESSELIENLPCLHGQSRSEIYNLLIQLVNDPENCIRMVRLNHRLFPKDQSLHEGFHADRGRWARSVAGHVGLQNMSNTCYLNSLMTQLFMNRSFRAFILGMPIDQMADSQRLLYFMKVLFARMQNSYTKAVEPKDFVEAITDYEGEQIDIAVQMDVDEFFNLIFDRLEGQMPSMELKSSFRSHYGGQLVQQVKSNECSHISERTEPFSAIQCDIKGKSTLQESLKAYVEGEIMDGDNKYSCTTCDRHVDAVKRTCLKDIPDHLIFHLKRFEFDLQTMHRSKINDCFEFPTSIDMRPYTMKYLSGDEKNCEKSLRDMFELVGVLVHSGTAESGHYYSYIRNRLSPSGAPEWFEFNDSEVSAFDPSTIPAACYGGTDGVTRDAMGQTYALSKPYSAYMLFYERSSLLSSSTVSQGAAAVQTKLSIPQELELEIHSENEYFIRKYCMFDNNHIEFVRKLLDQQQRLLKHTTHVDHSHEKKALLLGLDTLEQIATRFKDSTEGEALFNVLNSYLINCPDCCLEFFDWLCEKEDAIANLLVCNPYAKARGNFLRLVMFALNQVRRKRPELYGPGDDIGDHDVEFEETVLYKLCSSLMRSWNGLQWSIKTWNDYFGLLASISGLGEVEKVVMLELGFLRKTMELLLMDHLQAPRKLEYLFDNFTKIWTKRRPPLGNLGSVIGELMSLCDPHLRPCRDDESRYHLRHISRFPLTSTENEYFFFSTKNQMMILTRLLESQTTTESMGNLIAHIVRSEVAPAEGVLLEQIKATLLSGVPVDPAQEAEPFLMCLLYFISVTRSPGYVKEIIRRVADEVPTIGTDGGPEHFLFFQELANLRNPNLKQYLIRWRMVEFVGHWAPPLLTYCDTSVRDNTERLLDEILFDVLQDGVDRPRARKGVEDLMNGCFLFIESKFPRQRQPCDEKTFENVLRVLEKCGEYQEDENAFRTRNEGLRLLIEKIILEEEDADLASDEWGGSEIGSDTHEMEVQLDEYNST